MQIEKYKLEGLNNNERRPLIKNVVMNNGKAGFWIRFASIWIDLFIIGAAIKLVAVVLNRIGTYVPLELTVGLCFMVYSSILVGWRGRTIGKTLCGLCVRSSRDIPIGYLRALLRETVCKAVSAIFLFLGFTWVVFSRKKRAWHDYIARTMVVQDTGAIKRARLVLTLVLAINAVFFGSKVFTTIWRYNDAMRMAVGRNVITTYSQRNPSSLIEVSSLEQSDQTTFAKWLDENSKDPVDYVVEVAQKHQITIFGEVHHMQDDLQFLNRIIPHLYHRAGITCIAMEACASEDNADLAKLVTAEQFDPELALRIARNQGWKAWGGKEYWDVFETVWRLNKSLPKSKMKMRVVGIDFNWDGPSFGLTTTGDDRVGGPWWEKLRLFRLLNDLPLLLKRDEIMARNVEKEIIEKGERGIVWVGLNHDYINYRQARVINGKVISEWSRMGFMLHHKYGDQVFHIRLHTSYNSPMIAKLIEKIATERENVPVGFDVVGSPFALLRNSDSGYFRFRPGVCFSDVASGYVFLKPENKLKRCEWLSGYISREMFVKNKPFYEAKCGRKLRNAKEANKFIASKYGLHLAN